MHIPIIIISQMCFYDKQRRNYLSDLLKKS